MNKTHEVLKTEDIEFSIILPENAFFILSPTRFARYRRRGEHSQFVPIIDVVVGQLFEHGYAKEAAT